MARGKQRSTTRRDLVSGQILERAAALFAERGVSGTSLQEVADALEISRTALYHYIGSKEELLALLVTGITGETATSLEKLARDPDLEPVEKLRAAVRDMATRIARNPARFRLLIMSEGTLVEPLASEHHDARRRTLDALRDIVRQASQAGALRPVDHGVAAFALLGMCNWIAWWHRPDRPDAQTPEAIADTLAAIALEGLLPRGERGTPAEGDALSHALHLLQQDVSFLEQAIDGSRSGE